MYPLSTFHELSNHVRFYFRLFYLTHTYAFPKVPLTQARAFQTFDRYKQRNLRGCFWGFHFYSCPVLPSGRWVVGGVGGFTNRRVGSMAVKPHMLIVSSVRGAEAEGIDTLLNHPSIFRSRFGSLMAVWDWTCRMLFRRGEH